MKDFFCKRARAEDGIFRKASCMLLFGFYIASAVAQNENAEVHSTQCGCSTSVTTTCSSPAGDRDSCQTGRPGKRGSPGEKGEKGDAAENDSEAIAILQQKVAEIQKEDNGRKISDLRESFRDLENKNERLENTLDDLKFLFDLFHSFPSSCSEYIEHETTERRFERVPIYPGKGKGKSNMIIANCTRLDDLHNPELRATLEVPYNSIRGRTFILNGTRRQREGSNWINIFFSASGSRIFFIIDIVGDIVKVSDRLTTTWNTWERPITHSSPFKIDVPFSMKVTVDDIGYNCFVEEKQLFNFKHRQLPLSDLKSFSVQGNIDITCMSFN